MSQSALRTHSRIAAAVAGASNGCKIKFKKTSAQRVFAPPEHGTATDPSSDLSLRSLPHAIESSPNCLDSCQQVAAAWLSLPDFHLLDEHHILAIEMHIGAEANPRPSLRTPT